MITKCKDEKLDCFACDESGKCKVLDKPDFKDRECPFYKTKRQVLKETPDYYLVYGRKGKK